MDARAALQETKKHSRRPKFSDEHLPQLLEKIGATRRIRTADLLITNQLLYQLSYASA